MAWKLKKYKNSISDFKCRIFPVISEGLFYKEKIKDF